MSIEGLPPVLIPLGFTETEALVYGELLRQPDQTGYALSKAIQKGQPVTYAALAGLENKGAVMVGLAPARVYRAVPPAALLNGLRRSFDRRCDLAQQALEQTAEVTGGDQLFQLKTPEQVFERARGMLAAAQSTVLFTMFPTPLEELRGALTAASAREGVVSVGVVLRTEDRIDNARNIVPKRREQIQSAWTDEIAILVVDARQVLISSFNARRQVVRAIWTDSLFFSVLFHNTLTSDAILHEKMGDDWTGPNRELFGKLAPGVLELTRGIEPPGAR